VWAARTSWHLHQLILRCLLRLLFLVLFFRGDAENQRQDLTGRVRQYVAEQNASGNQGLVLVDMESAFDYYKLSEQRRKELFDDGIHLTQAGYNLMGDLVYQALERAMAI
jgi:lysophospholipase L1-like esterase